MLKTESNSDDCILELQGSEDRVLKAVSMANAMVEHVTSDGHLSANEFPSMIIGDEFQCVDNTEFKGVTGHRAT